MSLEDTSGPEPISTGQATEAPGNGGGQPAPESTTATQPEPATRTQAEADSVHPDFHKLPPEKQAELEPYYKALQADYTRKMQRIANRDKTEQQKIQTYDQFMSNPVENIKRMASQYGLTLTTAQAQAVADQQQQQSRGVSPDWMPNTWDEVLNKAGEYVSPLIEQKLQMMEERHQQELAELRATVGEYRQDKVSKQLAEIDPEWHQYEPEMRQLLDEIPGLAKNISALYRAAVPMEVIQARANQAALSKYEKKAQAAKIEGSGQSRSSSPAMKQNPTFDQAFQAAKESLRRR